jgi:hypothetical protein
MKRAPMSAALAILTLGIAFGTARAAPTTYRFIPIPATVERGVAVTLKVEIRVAGQNQLVPGAEITDAHVDRSPDGRPGEAHPAFFEPSLEYGVYRFRADLPTDGNWALSFVAKISGETLPVSATVTYTVTEPAAVRPSAGNPPK